MGPWPMTRIDFAMGNAGIPRPTALGANDKLTDPLDEIQRTKSVERLKSKNPAFST